jgi:endonuclease IV
MVEVLLVMDDIIKEIEKLRREHTELLDGYIKIIQDIERYKKFPKILKSASLENDIKTIEKITGKTWKEICEGE